MKRWMTYFVNGIITIVPIGLVLYVVVQIFQFLDNILGQYLRESMGTYFPGLGLLLTIVIITIVGWLASKYISKRILEFFERLLARIPFVKSLYVIVKETVQSILGEKRSFSKVALVQLPGTSLKVIGFVTSEDLTALGEVLEGHIAIYVPQSFQVAGLTVIVPLADVEWLDIKAEEAMRFILSAGVSTRD